jgi:peptidoglycan hydrolase-like protein with peptidoglycan-binding domain
LLYWKAKAVCRVRRLTATTVLCLACGATPALAAGGSGGSGLGTTTTGSAPVTTTTTGTTTTVTTTTAGGSGAAGATHKRSAKHRHRSWRLLSRVLGARMLSLGMSGTDVMVLQHDLTALGFSVRPSGHFNRRTLRRLDQFQRHYGLVVDGVAGPQSIGTLKRLLNRRLHITESQQAAQQVANGVAVTATDPSQPLPAGDSGLTGGVGLGTAGSSTTTSTTTTTAVPKATLVDGLAVPAPGTPQAVVTMLDAANSIAFDPYIYGGGHGSFIAPGYDCSGSVSFVLHAGGLLATPLDSEQFLQYGLPGRGQWVTIYTNGPTHAYMEIDGLWFDTAAQTALNGNDRWSPTRIAEPGYGRFVARHPQGF